MIDRTQANIHENDIGTVFYVRLRTRAGVLDLGAASSLSIRFRRPDQSGFERPAVVRNDGKDGWMKYETILGDLIPAGHWSIQGVVSYANGASFNSNLSLFIVYPNILITPPLIPEFPFGGIVVTDEGIQQGGDVMQLDFTGQVEVTDTTDTQVEVHVPEITTVDGGLI